MKITKTKIGLALVCAAWLANSATSINEEYRIRAKEEEAIKQRPYLVELLDKKIQLIDQVMPHEAWLSEINRLQGTAKKNYLEQIASLPYIQQKKAEVEAKVSAFDLKIKKVEDEINSIYSTDSELSNLRKAHDKCIKRGLFPFSILFYK